MVKKQNKKSSQKSLLNILWTKRYKIPNIKPFFTQFRVLLLIVIIVVGMITNILPFAYNTVRCGRLPVESSTFAAGYSYRLPGDRGYGVNIFSDYKYCTEAEIKATNGYHRDVFTDAAEKESQELNKQREEAQKFLPSRVNYKIYVPKGYAVEDKKMYEINGNIQTSYIVRALDGSQIGVRLLQKNDPYNICNPTDDPSQKYCKQIGTDSQGHELKRQYINFKSGWKSYDAGTTIGDTAIIIRTDNDQDALAISGSMTEYSD